jgi:low affinity Fe/Cu permease
MSTHRSAGAQPRVAHRTEQRSGGSRLLYRIDHYSSQSLVAIVAGGLLAAAFGVGLALGFPTGWVVAFETITSALTLTMVFAIQHTQAHEQAATQRKLDELLRAIPGAQTGLMLLEEASEDKMLEVEQEHREVKRDQVR